MRLGGCSNGTRRWHAGSAGGSSARSAAWTTSCKGRRELQRRLRDLWTEELMTTSVEQQMVEMRVTDVRRRQGDDEHARSVVVLEEVGGDRQISIWVGNWEASSIAMLLEKVKVPRPLTHAFTANLLRAGGVRVRQ